MSTFAELHIIAVFVRQSIFNSEISISLIGSVNGNLSLFRLARLSRRNYLVYLSRHRHAWPFWNSCNIQIQLGYPADLATRGFAISFMTLARAASSDCVFLFLCGMPYIMTAWEAAIPSPFAHLRDITPHVGDYGLRRHKNASASPAEELLRDLNATRALFQCRPARGSWTPGLSGAIRTKCADLNRLLTPSALQSTCVFYESIFSPARPEGDRTDPRICSPSTTSRRRQSGNHG
jgi:hypothetical protein